MDQALLNSGQTRGTIRLPASKSIAQRALVLAALARGESTITGITPSEDVAVLLRALDLLGIERAGDPPAAVRVRGSGGKLPEGHLHLHAGNNGTALRLLIALSALRPGYTTIEGAFHRPVAPLVDALNTLGATIGMEEKGKSVLVHVEGRTIRGGTIRLPSEISSQFATALLCIAPCVERGVTLELTGEVVSFPYVELTLHVLDRFGAGTYAGTYGSAHGSTFGGAIGSQGRRISVGAESMLFAAQFEVEGDASAAAFYLAAAAIRGGTVTVLGVGTDSAQGDVKILEHLRDFGCGVSSGGSSMTCNGPARIGARISCREHPDLVPVLAAIAPFVAGSTTLTDIGHLRHKESDRLSVLAEALGAIGCTAQATETSLEIRPVPAGELHGANLDPRGDHRMAMAFALLALRVPGIEILEPECVGKSDPEFFERLRSLFPSTV